MKISTRIQLYICRLHDAELTVSAVSYMCRAIDAATWSRLSHNLTSLSRRTCDVLQ